MKEEEVGVDLKENIEEEGIEITLHLVLAPAMIGEKETTAVTTRGVIMMIIGGDKEEGILQEVEGIGLPEEINLQEGIEEIDPLVPLAIDV